MTNTRTASHPRCDDCEVLLTPRTLGDTGNDSLCEYCFEAAGNENEHDDGYAAVHSQRCRVCDVYDPATYWDKYTRTPGFRPGGKQQHRSHAACAHAKTPKARAACRKARAAFRESLKEG